MALKESHQVRFEALSDFRHQPDLAKGAVQRGVERSYPAVGDAAAAEADANLRLRDRGLLPAAQAVPLWESVREALRATEYRFADPSHAKTSSGDMEAVYQWVTVNQLLGAATAGERRGILEMGGASMQAAFEPTTDLKMIMQSEFNLEYMTTGGRLEDIALFADSWLGFGANAAFSRLHTFLFQEGRRTNPCVNRGHRYIATLYHSSEPVAFTGVGEPDACSDAVRRSLIHPDWECLQEPCGIAGRYFPPPGDRKFVAISSFFHNVVNLNLMLETESKAVQLGKVLAKTQEVCRLTPEQVADNPEFNRVSFERIQWRTCFAGHLHYWVLKSFGFTDEGETIEYRSKIRGEEISWTRGAVLYQTH
eukprot:CAMPEP_0198499124 /NCGR_PEP_ID=MMETSP1462-20131121/7422_1 /TAXON_ID=1333877 /ORGANISM="Brandtodinium nutriculum, Strain RCC3387" /LENGTH=364 /DNA_ID=CAMNT_0044228081 /DNA_START=55 /DNA_END=1145 /DNA_ORIENTATION=-